MLCLGEYEQWCIHTCASMYIAHQLKLLLKFSKNVFTSSQHTRNIILYVFPQTYVRKYESPENVQMLKYDRFAILANAGNQLQMGSGQHFCTHLILVMLLDACMQINC